jgi:hypothetical protein
VSDRYLWDKTGEPDPEVERLERVLGRLGHAEKPLQLPETAPARPPRRLAFPRLPAWSFAAAAAAVVAVAALAVWGSWRVQGWEVARLAGAPRVAASAMGPTGRLGRGEWLETDAESRARLKVANIGVVEVEPNTRVRLVGTGAEHRLALAHGTLHAFILAPPRRFFVETPSATAIDLGCAYTLEVDPAGAGLLSVTLGWVSFEHQGRESFVPAGARCATYPSAGPGTPHLGDASDALKNALVAVDLAESRGAPMEEALGTVLEASRREDGLTLIHLLARLEGEDRARVYERMASLIPPPAGVTRERVMRGDRAALDLWWDELGFGSAGDWRRWKGDWPGPQKSSS